MSVVVPARDEADSLPVLLRSLSRLRTRPAEVLVVDDGSTDATAAVARAAGATVVSLDGPPDGWTGKAWACREGARASHGDRLLFLDADTELAPGALDGLLARTAPLRGLVSVQPFHRVRRPYEHLSAYPNAVSAVASGAFGRTPARRPMAFGPCLLTSRVDYERVGGHDVVRAEVLDDVRLAGAYAQAGLPVTCLVGGSALRFRMYPDGLGQWAEGWTKNIASGASAATRGPLAAAVGWLVVHHGVAVGTLTALALVATHGDLGGTTGLRAAVWLAGWVVVALGLRGVLRRLGSFGWWTWVLFPLPLLAFDLVFARSLALTALRRRVRWRGRDVRLDRQDGAPGPHPGPGPGSGPAPSPAEDA